MADITVGYNAAGAALDYTTIAAAFTAASGGDKLQIYYADANKSTNFRESINDGSATTKAISITGMLSGRTVTITTSTAQGLFYRLETSASYGGIVTVQNLTIIATSYAFYINLSGSAEGITIRNCAMLIGYYAGMGCRSFGSPDPRVENCLVVGADHGMRGGGTIAVNCTAIACGYGFNGITTKNCLGMFCTNGDFNSVTDTTCASTDGTGTAGLINLDPDDIKLWRDQSNSLYPMDFRILTSSVLYGAGTYDADVPTDCDGNARANPPSIGWHEGTATPFGVTHPTEAQVESGVTYHDWTAARTGALDTSAPTIPTLTVADDEDGNSATATISGADGGTTNRVYWAPRGGTPWTLGGTRSGDGTIEIIPTTGLGHYWAHCVSDNGSFSATAPVAFSVTSGTDSIAWQIVEAVESAIAAESYETEGSVAYTVNVEMPPRAETSTTPEILCFLESDAPEPMATNQDDMSYRVGVLISRRAETEAAVKNGIDIRRKIQKLFLNKRLTWYIDASCRAVGDSPTVNLAYLDESKALETAISLTFRVSENTA